MAITTITAMDAIQIEPTLGTHIPTDAIDIGVGRRKHRRLYYKASYISGAPAKITYHH